MLKHNTMKVYNEYRSKASHILNLDIRGQWSPSRSGRIYPVERSSSALSLGAWVVLKCVGHIDEEKDQIHLPEIESQSCCL
jgi:hypothetical protein